MAISRHRIRLAIKRRNHRFILHRDTAQNLLKNLKHYAEDSRPVRACIELSIYVKFLEKERKEHIQTENYRSRPVVAWY